MTGYVRASQAGFFGQMCHFGRIEAAASLGDASADGVATCAVLTRSSFDNMRRAEPELTNLLEIYLARKRFIDTGKMNVQGKPKLLL
eukprot:SAG22_NODE_168_length_16723_cov_6.542409_3_plen_87_part_00